MDPNATLKEIRTMAQGTFNDSDVDRFLKLVEGLDYWLTHGGFLPKDWDHGGSDGSHQAG